MAEYQLHNIFKALNKSKDYKNKNPHVEYVWMNN
jgi:hypothetical protein